MTPNNEQDVHHMEQVLKVSPKGVELIVLVELYVRLRDLRDKSCEDLVTFWEDRGLVNMADHFLP